MNFKSIKEELDFVMKRNKIMKDISQLLEERNCIKVETEYFEAYDSYTDLNKGKDLLDTVKVVDNQGRVLVLRPDSTSNIIRQILPRFNEEEIYKLYYIEPVFYYSSSGVIEKRKQCGVEIIGDDTVKSDAELVSMVGSIFKNFKLNPIIEIGNQKFVDLLVEESVSNMEDQKKLKEILTMKNQSDLNDFVNQNKVEENYRAIVSNVFNYQNDLQQMYDDLEAIDAISKLTKIVADMMEVKRQLGSYQVSFDLSMMSSFDYYSGIIFRGYLEGYKNDVFRGGRYDLKKTDYDKEIPALGFSFDLNTVYSELIENE